MQSSSDNAFSRMGPRPKIFDRVPIKAEDIKVVFYYNCEYYGVRPGSNLRCLMTKQLSNELVKLPGVVAPKQIIDLRKWQEKGILHITEREFNKTDAYFMLRWLALTKKDIVFIIVHPQAHLMAKFFVDKSENIFIPAPKMKDSDIFKFTNNALINMGMEPIDWAIV